MVGHRLELRWADSGELVIPKPWHGPSPGSIAEHTRIGCRDAAVLDKLWALEYLVQVQTGRWTAAVVEVPDAQQ